MYGNVTELEISGIPISKFLDTEEQSQNKRLIYFKKFIFWAFKETMFLNEFNFFTYYYTL